MKRFIIAVFITILLFPPLAAGAAENAVEDKAQILMEEIIDALIPLKAMYKDLKDFDKNNLRLYPADYLQLYGYDSGLTMPEIHYRPSDQQFQLIAYFSICPHNYKGCNMLATDEFYIEHLRLYLTCSILTGDPDFKKEIITQIGKGICRAIDLL